LQRLVSLVLGGLSVPEDSSNTILCAAEEEFTSSLETKSPLFQLVVRLARTCLWSPLLRAPPPSPADNVAAANGAAEARPLRMQGLNETTQLLFCLLGVSHHGTSAVKPGGMAFGLVKTLWAFDDSMRITPHESALCEVYRAVRFHAFKIVHDVLPARGGSSSTSVRAALDRHTSKGWLANIEHMSAGQKAKHDGVVALAVFPLGYYSDDSGAAVCSSSFMSECAFQCIRSLFTLPVLPHRVSGGARKALTTPLVWRQLLQSAAAHMPLATIQPQAIGKIATSVWLLGNFVQLKGQAAAASRSELGLHVNLWSHLLDIIPEEALGSGHCWDRQGTTHTPTVIPPMFFDQVITFSLLPCTISLPNGIAAIDHFHVLIAYNQHYDINSTSLLSVINATSLR
jgi:hypothetical protein